ncbi:hypothetical protein MKO06_13140 [Gramella sp. GC03-9]|uniref:DUF4064 domain-containing protein n=1 Tax=Christiangramia oceanisediminis TaxID=2920386 RepID=A0A9X2RB34_9FLAO|nr:hypothetical protein [Gramella oceanisediminis]MCP9200859.1 hypothetical protein [Gramella oceanisediminis]
MDTNHNNLHVFKILFIIKGILSILLSFLPVIYFFIGTWMVTSQVSNDEHAGIAGGIMMVVGGFIFLFLLALGIVTILAGKYIGEQRRYTFVLVVAIVNCITGILGILLGIFSIIELNKPEVRKLFGKNA